VERNLEGRCGTCGFFIELWRNERDIASGECRLGCWPSPLADTGTCSSHKPVGASFDGVLKRRKVAGAPRRYGEADGPPPPKPLPREVDIDMDMDDFRQVLREVLLEETGIRSVHMSERWHGGEVVLVPGKEGTQEKRMPIDAFFHKIVMVRDKLRVLEQKVNAHKGLAAPEKAQLTQYITGCYGSLTSFNVLFKERDDGFVGQRKNDE